MKGQNESDAMKNDTFPLSEIGTVEFDGIADPVLKGGRRKKRQREAKKRNKPGTFGAMGLDVQLLRNITTVCKFKMPTPIQRKSIPLMLQGLDIVGMARTGSGKTAAFVIPILQRHILTSDNEIALSRLKGHSTMVGARCLILSPSRELALQTFAVMGQIGKDMGFRISVLVGGDALSEQFMQLAANPDILVATPGRLVHLLKEVKDFSLQSIQIVVFDEADRLFELGFVEQIHQITQSLPSDRQTVLFSATMPRLLAEFTKSGLSDPQVIRLDTESILSPDLELFFFTVRHEDKAAALLYLLRYTISKDEASIVFCSTKHHVAFLSALLQSESIENAFVYGTMDQVRLIFGHFYKKFQSARKIQVAKFRNGIVKALLVTDVAARGVDLPLIDNVIHFDFPPIPKLFVHRSGRTARAGRSGKAYSLLSRNDLPYLLDLHLFLSKSISPADGNPCEDTSSSFGHFPTTRLSLLSDTVQTRINTSDELQGFVKSAENGFKLYLKTRPSASSASIQRAKQFPEADLHPLFLNTDDRSLQKEKECEDFSKKLKAFRPTASVFDEAVSQNKSSSSKKSPMPPDRLSRKETTAKEVELTLGAYRDPVFYVPHEPSDRATESGLSVRSGIDPAVMDLLGEDQESLARQRRQYHWDRRSKRYICLPQGEKLKSGKRIRMENGVKISERKTKVGKIYESWSKSQKTKIQSFGTQEDSRLTKRATGALEHIGKRFATKPKIETEGESTLTPEQIRKKKQHKAQLRWKNLPKERKAKTPRPGKGKKYKG